MCGNLKLFLRTTNQVSILVSSVPVLDVIDILPPFLGIGFKDFTCIRYKLK